MIVDAHNDLLLELAFRAYRLGEENPFRRHWLDQLEKGGVRLQVCPVSSASGVLDEGMLRHVLEEIAVFNAAVRDNADRVAAIRSREDLAAVMSGERLGLMLSMEGVEALAYSPLLFELFWALGVRMVSLTWNRRNPFADGAGEKGGGLSRLGEQLVDLLGRLRAMIDLVHASEQTFWEIVERSDDAPLLVSHAACRAVHDHPRNLTDAQLEAVAARGGVLGIMFHPIAIDGTRWDVERVVDHFDHAVQVMGIEHVGVGSDFIRQVLTVTRAVLPADALLPPGLSAESTIEGLAGPADLPNLVAGLERRGYRGDDLAAILGGNLVRLFQHALPGEQRGTP